VGDMQPEEKYLSKNVNNIKKTLCNTQLKKLSRSEVEPVLRFDLALGNKGILDGGWWKGNIATAKNLGKSIKKKVT